MIYIEMRANSPLALSSRYFASNEVDTLDYIPGSAFRGAMADKLGKELGYDTPIFSEIFLNGRVKVGNLYLLKGGQGFPIPKSARTCKYLKGFRPHAVIDFLLSAVEYRLTENAFAFPRVCPLCKAPLASFDGFYVRTGERIDPTKRLITRTAIDDRTLTARQGVLYSIETIEEDQEFYGMLDADSVLVIEDEELRHGDTTILRKGEILWLGLGKTRGFGNVEITAIRNLGQIFSPDLVPGNVENRFEKFQQRLSRLNINGFAITLFSDAIMIDKFMRYRSWIDGQYLKEEFNLDNVELLCAFNSTREILGWNVAWGLPKETEMAIEKGSTFFFKCDAKQENLCETLKQIELEGVGLRREEGFGRVYICDTFHTEYLPQNWEG